MGGADLSAYTTGAPGVLGPAAPRVAGRMTTATRSEPSANPPQKHGLPRRAPSGQHPWIGGHVGVHHHRDDRVEYGVQPGPRTLAAWTSVPQPTSRHKPWPGPSSSRSERFTPIPSSLLPPLMKSFSYRLASLLTPTGQYSDRFAFGDFSNAFSQSLAIIALDRRSGAPTSAVNFLDGTEVTGIVGIYTDPKHVMAYSDSEVRQQFSICFRGR